MRKATSEIGGPEQFRSCLKTLIFTQAAALEHVFDGAAGVYGTDLIHPGALHAVMDETTAELQKIDDEVDMTTSRLTNSVAPHRAVAGETYDVHVWYKSCKGGDALITETVATIKDARGFEVCRCLPRVALDASTLDRAQFGAGEARLARLSAVARMRKQTRTDNYHYIWHL